VPTCGSPVGEGAMRTRTPEVVILFARHKRPGRAWDKRRPTENVYLDQETGRKRASCRFYQRFPYGWP